ncbi:hypothetical protein NKJ73_30855 [Mesorhizobium sp. M0074]
MKVSNWRDHDFQHGSRIARGNSLFWRIGGCSLLSGLFMQPFRLRAPAA